MNTNLLPPDIKVIHDDMSTTRYVLPKRNLGSARKFGWGPIFFGLIFTTFMIFWMSGPIAGGFHSNGIGSWLSIVFGLMGLPGLAVGLGFIALGIIILTNGSHSEIVVGNGVIVAIERIGAIPIHRKRPVSDLKQLIIGKGGITMTDHNQGTTKTFAPGYGVLTAETSSGKSMWLAIFYPHDLLRPLANVLSATLSLGGHPLAPVIEIEPQDGTPPEREIQRPAVTDITCQTNPQGLAIAVPAKGLMKGSQGLFAFSIIWNGFMAVFTGLMIKGHPPLPAYLFIAVFWAIGILMLLYAIHMAKRTVLLAVINNVLAYRVIGPYKTREQKIPIATIQTIQVGPSGMTINDRPVMEIQIIPKNGKKIGLLSNRSSEEQEWIAYTLRQTLKP